MIKGLIVYTQSLDAAALRVADTQGSRTLFAYRLIQQHGSGHPYDHYHEWNSAREARDLSASGSSRRTARVSVVPSPETPLPLTPKKDKAPVLLSSLPNESALLTDSEDDSDTNETSHDAEIIFE